MHGCVTTSRPTSTLAQKRGVFDLADVNPARASRGLRLGVAFEAEIRIALGEHFSVHRAVRLMTDHAALAHGFMLEHVRAALGRMALQATVILRQQSRSAEFIRRAFVRVMAFRATHLAFGNRMMIR